MEVESVSSAHRLHINMEAKSRCVLSNLCFVTAQGIDHLHNKFIDFIGLATSLLRKESLYVKVPGIGESAGDSPRPTNYSVLALFRLLSTLTEPLGR